MRHVIRKEMEYQGALGVSFSSMLPPPVLLTGDQEEPGVKRHF